MPPTLTQLQELMYNNDGTTRRIHTEEKYTIRFYTMYSDSFVEELMDGDGSDSSDGNDGNDDSDGNDGCSEVK